MASHHTQSNCRHFTEYVIKLLYQPDSSDNDQPLAPYREQQTHKHRRLDHWNHNLQQCIPGPSLTVINFNDP